MTPLPEVSATRGSDLVETFTEHVVTAAHNIARMLAQRVDELAREVLAQGHCEGHESRVRRAAV
jgi:hypothetical protein